MGRFRARKGPPIPPAIIEVGDGDPLPTRLLDYLLALPAPDASHLTNNESHEPSQSSEPSSKRRKVNPLPDACIFVARGEISFSSQCEGDPSLSQSKVHQDVGSFLWFTLRDGHLLIRSRPTSPLGRLYARVSLRPGDISQNIGHIVDVADSNLKKQSDPGAIWTAVDLVMERHQNVASVKLSFRLFWNETPSLYTASLRRHEERKSSEKLVRAFFPAPDEPPGRAEWSPMDFYDAAHVPPKEDATPLSIQVLGLEATLFPYQKRSLQWLLRREGVKWTASQPGLQPLVDGEQGPDLAAFRVVRDANDREVYLSDVFQTITRSTTTYHQLDRVVRGGILAEEMGLGKTLEIISLILLHRRRQGALHSQLPQGHENLVPSGATFIVAPKSLAPQWISELSRHAPGLRVKFYTGCRGLEQQDEARLVEELAGYDVVVATYAVLSAELHFAISPPERSRRRERAYHRITSPLVQISWWRVCLDEAQMIESGVSQAAALARVIPRVNAWGITGTPVKNDVKDLLGLLSFLRYEPYCSVNHFWQALTIRHKPLFQQLFGSISLRHTKALVRDEISLPPQKRFVISMPFTAVEEQHYQSLYKDMAEACNLSLVGAPLVDDWRPEDYEEVMRVWLNRLRQTALHPDVGVYGRRVLGNSKERPMRTVEEVLDAMLEQSETSIRADERAYLSSRLALGQLFENSPRVKEALAIWEQVRDETAKLVSDVRAKLHDAICEQRGDNIIPQQTSDDNLEDPNDLSDSDSDNDPDDGPGNKGQVGEHRIRLRGVLELYHKAVFFCANAYFQIKDNQEMTEPDSAEFHRLKKLEDNGYEDAKTIRRQLLREAHRKATRLTDKIAQKAEDQSFTEVSELTVGAEKGIESSGIIDNLEVLYDELNAQAEVIDEWREQAIQLLLKPLIDEEENVETTGEELSDSTKVQEELVVYVQALRAVIADRQEAISGQANELVRQETKSSMRLARDGDGPAPEKLLDLFRLRDAAKPTRANISMRAAISDFRSLLTRLTHESGQSQREMLESRIASDLLKKTQALFSEQHKAISSLESEMESFKKAMNARLDYYRQLQAVSDDVLPDESPKTEQAIERARKTVNDLHRKLLSGEAKHRYLLNLKEAGSKSNEPRMCVICQTPFVTGVLTVCGHQFCKECMMMWFKAHHNCPVCKRALKADNLHDITLNPQQLQVHSERSSRSTEEADDDDDDDDDGRQQRRNTTSKKTMIYSEFNAEKLAEMKNIELDGPSFTTKVDTLVRHLLWLRESDPGAKSIVFSQYKDFLGVLHNAFRRFRIGYASIDEPSGISKFKEDPAIECFLLHARAHSSGLNLVNASHVFLCEPLLNTALELQAIARVDRIGQRHETTVWLYVVSGTVEESIYNLSVRRRMEHMGRGLLRGKSKESTPELLDASMDEANTLEMEHAALSRLMSKDRSAGEVVDRSDLWECLFGHVADRGGVHDGNDGGGDDDRLQERAVVSYLAGEAAEARWQG